MHARIVIVSLLMQVRMIYLPEAFGKMSTISSLFKPYSHTTRLYFHDEGRFSMRTNVETKTPSY